MASIFKPPKITQEQLSSTLLEYGEIVYNTTKNEFFTGNGTSGGITLFNEKPTTTSELINDSNFVTSSDVEESLSAYQLQILLLLQMLKNHLAHTNPFPG